MDLSGPSVGAAHALVDVESDAANAPGRIVKLLFFSASSHSSVTLATRPSAPYLPDCSWRNRRFRLM